jgi:hypothetical protein
LISPSIVAGRKTGCGSIGSRSGLCGLQSGVKFRFHVPDRENRPSMQTRDIDYRDPSDRRSWASMRSLLDEVFR